MNKSILFIVFAVPMVLSTAIAGDLPLKAAKAFYSQSFEGKAEQLQLKGGAGLVQALHGKAVSFKSSSARLPISLQENISIKAGSIEFMVKIKWPVEKWQKTGSVLGGLVSGISKTQPLRIYATCNPDPAIVAAFGPLKNIRHCKVVIPAAGWYNSWHHVGLTWKQHGNGVLFWIAVDGQIANYMNNVKLSPDDFGSELMLGGGWALKGIDSSCLIDELKLFNFTKQYDFPAAGTNLVINPGVEADFNLDKVPDNWANVGTPGRGLYRGPKDMPRTERGGSIISSLKSYSGNNSLHIQAKRNVDGHAMCFMGPVQPGKVYEFDAAFYAAYPKSIKVQISWLGKFKQKRTLVNKDRLPFEIGRNHTKSWSKFSAISHKRFLTAPPAAETAVITLLIRGPLDICLDDVFFAEKQQKSNK